MTLRRSVATLGGCAAICLLAGCVGSLLHGGKPDSLYRLDASERVAVSGPAAAVRHPLFVDKLRFAPEIDGDRLLAVQAGTARYIKGVRWVTSARSLFAQALLREFQTRLPALRVTAAQGGVRDGYSLAVTVARFEAVYDDPTMTAPPTIVIAGEATLYALPARTVIGQRHFVTRIRATRSRAGEIVAAFDRATLCHGATIARWIAASTLQPSIAEDRACVASS